MSEPEKWGVNGHIGGGPSGCIEGVRDLKPSGIASGILLLGLIGFAAQVALVGCASQPIEAQLATACNQAATALREAAILKANGKLSPSANDAIVAVIPSLEAGCDPANPPQNLTMALANVSQALQTITLQNAGVH